MTGISTSPQLVYSINLQIPFVMLFKPIWLYFKTSVLGKSSYIFLKLFFFFFVVCEIFMQLKIASIMLILLQNLNAL